MHHAPTNDSEEEAKDQFYEQLAKNTIGYTKKQANKDERGKKRWRASHPNKNQRSQECLQTNSDKKEAFVQGSLMKRF
jgi:hypothetical protein